MSLLLTQRLWKSQEVPPGPALRHGMRLPTYKFTETPLPLGYLPQLIDSLFPSVLRSGIEKSRKAILTYEVKEINKEEISVLDSLKKNEFSEVFEGKYFESTVAIKVFNNVQSRNPK